MKSRFRTPLRYFDLIETFPKPGCAICNLLLHEVDQYINALLYEFANSPDMHAVFSAGRGFCTEHGQMLRENKLSNVIGINFVVATFHKLRRLTALEEARDAVVVLPVVAQHGHAVPAPVQEGQHPPDQGAAEMHFPGHMRSRGQDPPHHRPVQETDQQGNRDRAHVPAQDAADAALAGLGVCAQRFLFDRGQPAGVIRCL